ncbi:Transcription initiation factor TFIID subunit 8 [Neolecta irregularis DAH-3]|uniref:Transcription initiation factor TFIID subunit 8 n=1 Tax=Neolecta irregularis (strain DAH-3) TaxID=1198029 RepID=A0A1U7LHE4_NEOID|nr:Transcription initiation factor TFIID subunit 8 [Neolecta irregularis DAH-3]|eukprot:OLL22048.1 Transcription initiation factor TFIID subunit 8 [Neolecta irregularis DAH-3]
MGTSWFLDSPTGTNSLLVDRSIFSILQSTGYDSATPAAVDHLRIYFEAYLKSLASDILHFTHAKRHRKPMLADVALSFICNRIGTGGLETELERLTGPLSIPETISVESSVDAFLPSAEIDRLLGSSLDGTSDRQKFIPTHMPQFPAKHTYLSTPVYSKRQTAPRFIREKATEQARLAEEALRKFLVADKLEEDLTLGKDKAFETAWKEMGFEDEKVSDAFMGCANSEKQYWRRRKHVGV